MVPAPEFQDELEDVGGWRGDGPGALRRGPRRACSRAEEAREIRRRHRSAREAQVPQGKELDAGFHAIPMPRAGVSDCRQQVRCWLVFGLSFGGRNRVFDNSFLISRERRGVGPGALLEQEPTHFERVIGVVHDGATERQPTMLIPGVHVDAVLDEQTDLVRVD